MRVGRRFISQQGPSDTAVGVVVLTAQRKPEEVSEGDGAVEQHLQVAPDDRRAASKQAQRQAVQWWRQWRY